MPSNSVRLDETRHRTSSKNVKRRAQQVNEAQPVEKRKRILHACDECRRKKIKCDGKKPCIHCAVYSYRKSKVSSAQQSLK